MNTHSHAKLIKAVADWHAAGSPGADASHRHFPLRRTVGLHIRAHAAAHGISQVSVAKALGKRVVDVTFQDMLDAVHDPKGGQS